MNDAFENQNGGKTLKRLFDTYRTLDWICVYIFLSINSSKRQKKVWKRLVLLLYGNQCRSQKDTVPITAYVRSIRSAGVGNTPPDGP